MQKKKKEQFGKKENKSLLLSRIIMDHGCTASLSRCQRGSIHPQQLGQIVSFLFGACALHGHCLITQIAQLQLVQQHLQLQGFCVCRVLSELHTPDLNVQQCATRVYLDHLVNSDIISGPQKSKLMSSNCSSCHLHVPHLYENVTFLTSG